MTRVSRDERGFTLVELLVGIGLLAIASVGFYQVMLSGTTGSRVSRSVVQISEEARLGLNRMIRDTREAERLVEVSPTSYTLHVDFDGNGEIENPNANGDPEELTFAFSGNAILLNNEVLVRGVGCVRNPDGTCRPVFSYTSKRLEYDWNGDGVTTQQELEDASSHGVNLDVLDELNSVRYALRIRSGDRETDFFTEAQLRNRR